jgi:site-specific DNA recombinase
MVWNRQWFVKDPDTGKRQARPNPPSEWIRKDVPALRIIDDELWEAVKARQATTRHTTQEGLGRVRRPKYLFSGLTMCETCGGGFVLSSRDTLVCFNATSRGTCTNARKIKRQEVEARVLRALRERFFEPGAFAECGFAEEMESRRKEHLAQLAGSRRELVTVEREIKKCIDAIKRGVPGEAVKDESPRSTTASWR